MWLGKKDQGLIELNESGINAGQLFEWAYSYSYYVGYTNFARRLLKDWKNYYPNLDETEFLEQLAIAVGAEHVDWN